MTADYVVTIAGLAVVAAAAVAAVVLQRRRTAALEPFMRPRPNQDRALLICAAVFDDPAMAHATIVWRTDVGEDGLFESGWSVGRVRELIKFGKAHVRARPGSTVLEQFDEMAHVLGHVFCERHMIGPEPVVLGWHRDYGHTVPRVWGTFGLVAEAQRRFREAGL